MLQELNDQEMMLIDGQGPGAAVGAAIVGAIGGAVLYGVGTSKKDRSPGGWFSAVAGGAAAGAAGAILLPTP